MTFEKAALSHLSNEELVQMVWATATDRTPLEAALAERLATACDAVADLEQEVQACGPQNDG